MSVPTVTLPRVLLPATPALSVDVAGSTLGEAIEALFERAPGLRVHLLDEGGHLRPHVSCFVDGVSTRLEDRDRAVGDAARIDFIQAVSGGS